MATSDNQTRILRYAVLTGLSPLVPVPILDDIVKSYFQRRLVRRLAETNGVTLDDASVRALADEVGGSCLLGCLGMALLYPIKRLIRKILIFLEWKRAVDLTSLTFHRGYLLDVALANGRLAPAGPKSAAEVRAAIDATVAEARVKPVEEAIRETFRQSKNALEGAVGILRGAVQGLSRTSRPDDVAAAVESVRGEEEARVSGVVDSLNQRLRAVPADYYKELEAKLLERLR